MIDKVQKIREEIERLKEETSIGLSEHENGVEQGRMEIIDALSLFLDSMQEEPVSSIWHDASEKSNKAEDVVVINPSDNTGEILTGCIKVYQGRIWAYTSDLLKINKPTSTVYVVTRSEEHTDYVEKVFFDKDKANKYCNQFKGNEDAYVRYITKVEVTL